MRRCGRQPPARLPCSRAHRESRERVERQTRGGELRWRYAVRSSPPRDPDSVAIRDHVEHQRCISDIARKRSERCESMPVLGVSTGQRNQTRCRFDADDATAGGGDADGSTAVRPDGKRGHARSHRHRGASARAAGRALRFHGLRGAAKASGSVNGQIASSGMTVLPTITAPASRSRRTMIDLRRPAGSDVAREP